MAPRVVVFVDYQNAHASGHGLYCDAFDPIYNCLIDPLKLGELLVARRAPGGTLKEVRVYRGRPDPRKEPRLTAANDKHFDAWKSDVRVMVKRRPLMYPEDWNEPGCVERPREKGIDVSLAVDMVRLAYEKKYDVGILFSRDSDLKPPLEMVRDLKLAHVEVASWDGASVLRLPGIYLHKLSRDDFAAVRDTRTYVV